MYYFWIWKMNKIEISTDSQTPICLVHLYFSINITSLLNKWPDLELRQHMNSILGVKKTERGYLIIENYDDLFI